MGLIVHQAFTTKHGIHINSFYCSIGTSPVTIKREGGLVYIIDALLTYWFDHNTRETFKQPIHMKPMQLKIKEDQFYQHDIYTHIYNELKINFQTYEDSL